MVSADELRKRLEELQKERELEEKMKKIELKK